MTNEAQIEEERQKKIDLATNKIAGYIGVAFRTPDGVILTPKQVDDLVLALIKQGWKNAASTLKEAGEAAKADGSSLTRVAAFAIGANFLDDQIELAKQYES